jgi:hypothetical protein
MMRRRCGTVHTFVAEPTCVSCALAPEIFGGPIIVAARVTADITFEIHLICISCAVVASQSRTAVSLVITPGHSLQIQQRRAKFITREQKLLLRDPDRIGSNRATLKAVPMIQAV